MPVASVLTKCQEEVSHIPAVHPGSFRPKCDENGNYLPLQCYGSIGYCWCVFPNGTEVPNTRSRGHHNCSGKQWHCASVRGPGRTRKVEGQEVPSEAHGTRTPGMAAPGGSDVVMRPALYPSTHLCIPICPFIISPLTSTHLFVHLSVSPFICEFHPSMRHPLASRSPTDPPISSPPSHSSPHYTSLLLLAAVLPWVPAFPGTKPAARWETLPSGILGQVGCTSSDKWTCCSFAESLELEDPSSGLGVTKQDLGPGKGLAEGHLVTSSSSPAGPAPLWAGEGV